MTSASPARSRRWRTMGFIALPVLALVALVSWGFASPTGSSPDDGYHLTSIWCGGAASAELCSPGRSTDERLVSPDLAYYCYQTDAAASASCIPDDLGADLRDGRESTDYGNFAGLYPPVFYTVMSVFATDDLMTSVLIMRAASAVLFVGVVTALFFLLPARRRSTLVASAVVTIVPLGMFLIPSNNPSSWAILSAVALWISLLGYFETTGIRRLLLATVAVLAAVFGAGARADSALYVGVAVIVAVVLTATRTRSYLLRAIFPAVIAVGAGLAFLGSKQSSALETGLAVGGAGYGKYTLIVQNLLELPGLWAGSFGTWRLGWFDTEMPAVVAFASGGVFLALMLAGARLSDRRTTIAALFVTALLVFVPMYLLYQSDARVGAQVQPRYILPLIILLAGILLLGGVGGTGVRITRWQAVAAAAALSIANCVALHENIRRYVTGSDVIAANLDTAIEWWWDVPFSPMAVWLVGSVAFAATVLWLARSWTAPAELDATSLVSPRQAVLR